MSKQILAIHLADRTYVDQDVLQQHCKHEHTIMHYIRGVTPQDNDYEVICLDCGKVLDPPMESTVNPIKF